MKSYSYRDNLEKLPVRDGFRMRGENMTRIEVFTDAAFAFAITLLVVSLEGIPDSYPEFIQALKDIPAFAASFAQLTFFWYAHRIWSQRYGLEDIKTITISCILVFFVLVFVFPLKINFSAFFHYISGGYLPAPMTFGAAEIKTFFIIFHISFICMCSIILLLYLHAKNYADQLFLNDYELVATQGGVNVWMIILITSFTALIACLIAPGFYSAYSGSIYATMGVSLAVYGKKLSKQLEDMQSENP